MSFGFSVGDFVAVPTLAWQVYKSCKDSSDDFKAVANDVVSLHIVLKEVEEQLKDQDLDEARQARLAQLSKNSHRVLTDLETLLNRYDNLSTQSQWTWDRMRWGFEDVNQIRLKLANATALLTAFNTSLVNSSQARIEKLLRRFLADHRTGARPESSIHSIESLSHEDKTAWQQMRRELEDIGISTSTFLQHRPFIVKWFRAKILDGEFQSQGSGGGDDVAERHVSPPPPYEEGLEVPQRQELRTWNCSKDGQRVWSGSKLESGVFLGVHLNVIYV